MKGILLAGGSGTRLHPLTLTISKQILPVYDKPMVYYPLSVLMLAGIKDIMLICTERDLPSFTALLGDGSNFGVNIQYEVQASPEGLPQALTIAEEFLGGDSCLLVLGDNIFYGDGLTSLLKDAAGSLKGANIFSYRVNDPERYGVVEFDGKKVISLEEKPSAPKSKYVITGMYMFDNNASNIARSLKKSVRGEYEIVDVLQRYLEQESLESYSLGRGMAWLDTGTHESLLDAGNFVHAIEKRQGLRIACLEEIGFRNGWIDEEMLLLQSAKYKKSGYGDYLASLLD